MEERNDEIDLLELSRNMMVRFYNYVQRRYKMLGIFAIVGGILGLGFYFKDKDKYENIVIGTSYVIHPTVIVDIINSLQEINRNDKEAISRFLALNKEEANSLISIEADTIQTVRSMSGSPLLTTISVSIKFKSDLDLTNFSKHLCNYIDSNQYVKKELNLEKNRIQKLIERYDVEISKLDSLQRKLLASNLESASSQAGNMLIIGDKNNSFYNNEIINLENRKLGELGKLERLTGLSIIDEKRGTKIKEASLTSTIAKFMAVFFALGFVVSIILEFKRQVKHIEQSKNNWK